MLPILLNATLPSYPPPLPQPLLQLRCIREIHLHVPPAFQPPFSSENSTFFLSACPLPGNTPSGHDTPRKLRDGLHPSRCDRLSSFTALLLPDPHHHPRLGLVRPRTNPSTRPHAFPSVVPDDPGPGQDPSRISFRPPAATLSGSRRRSFSRHSKLEERRRHRPDRLDLDARLDQPSPLALHGRVGVGRSSGLLAALFRKPAVPKRLLLGRLDDLIQPRKRAGNFEAPGSPPPISLLDLRRDPTAVPPAWEEGPGPGFRSCRPRSPRPSASGCGRGIPRFRLSPRSARRGIPGGCPSGSACGRAP